MKVLDSADEWLRAAVYVAAGVLLVHVFSPAPLDLAGSAIHVLAVCLCFTAAYTLAIGATTAVAPRLPPGIGGSPLVRIWAPSILAVTIGIVLLRAVSALSPADLHFDHDDENWPVKLAAIWIALTAALHQSVENRRLASELRDIGAQIRAAPHAAPRPVAGADVEVDGRRFSPAMIVCIAADENYCQLHVKDRQHPHLVRATLSNLEQKLANADFVRTHRSYLINLAHVADVKQDGRTCAAVLVGGLEAPISRGRMEAFMDAWRKEQRVSPSDAACPQPSEPREASD